MSLQRLRIGEDTDGLYRAIDAVGRAEYSYFWDMESILASHPARGATQECANVYCAPIAALSSSTLSVFSHGNSTSVRPK